MNFIRHHKMPRFLVALLGCTLFLAGCTSLFFQGTRERYPFVDYDKLIYEKDFFASLDGSPLSYWYFASDKNRQARPELVQEANTKTRGLVVQYHGNAENMTIHYRSLVWLPFYGYDFMTFDYRGYAASKGESTLSGVNADARAMLAFADEKSQEQNLPLVLYGQSLGGALLLRALEDAPTPKNLKLIVIESSFYSYKRVARQKLANAWLFWPLSGSKFRTAFPCGVSSDG